MRRAQPLPPDFLSRAKCVPNLSRFPGRTILMRADPRDGCSRGARSFSPLAPSRACRRPFRVPEGVRRRAGLRPRTRSVVDVGVPTYDVRLVKNPNPAYASVVPLKGNFFLQGEYEMFPEIVAVEERSDPRMWARRWRWAPLACSSCARRRTTQRRR